ncbi:type IV pilus twitching motility protein PilT [Roseisolibacter sp. H3M3-2]|uniref:type IV pilus twitching motility protein PilT n=1 Tax=Roseisolibacter sp. H3M3-2 TaxID=3031323 RepID=UPI0023D9ABD0|nr:type IV pilus twitching motility protein PilT [Roseisolibacter sp. H3M3-2]MDF1503431.1 type IV pilus twitching motility protein PilT [Roseisolibacter sp. H3M3-2]
MPQVDRLLSALAASRGDAVELLEGEPAAFLAGGARRPVTRQALTGTQLLAFLREIAPADAVARLDGAQPTDFRYASPDGPFDVQVTRVDQRWLARLAPAGAAPTVTTAVPATPVGAAGVAPAPAAPVVTEAAPVAGFVATAYEDAFGAPANTAPPAATAGAAAAAAAPRAVVGDSRAHAAMDRLLRILVERGGSDLHLRHGEPPIIRSSGHLERLEEPKLDGDAIEAMITAIMPDRNRHEYAERNDTDYAYEIAGCARFRANALRDRLGPAAVFRVIPATVVSVEDMKISPEVQQLCYLTKGLVLVTGPTGSGKSTTLCSLVDLVNRSRSDHILTIEDPIEFVHPNKQCVITQRQVGVHTDSFKSALRAALREDPDVILVGELRDLETISIAIETAETGHLVFGTLHTTTAPSTVDRIIDQFPADRQSQIRVMLSESLKGVISQTLCRKIGGGRAAAREILLATPAVSNLIREGKTFQIPSIMQTSRKLGMVTLNDALLELVDAKTVEPREAWTKAVDKSSFVAALKQRGVDTAFADAAK